jgi:hypothetical protein
MIYNITYSQEVRTRFIVLPISVVHFTTIPDHDTFATLHVLLEISLVLTAVQEHLRAFAVHFTEDPISFVRALFIELIKAASFCGNMSIKCGTIGNCINEPMGGLSAPSIFLTASVTPAMNCFSSRL